MSRREMLGERQVAAPLMAPRAAHGALRPAHRRFQPGEGVGVQLARLRLSGKPDWPSQCQFGHKTLVLGFALITPAASRPGQHGAMRRQRGRQVAPCGHASTVGQRFPRLVRQDDQCGRPVRSPCPIPPPWPIGRGAPGSSSRMPSRPAWPLRISGSGQSVTSAETRLTELRDSPALPDQPDRAWVDDWLYRSYLDFWAQRH